MKPFCNPIFPLQVQEDAGDHHGLSQATTSRICARVARALARQAASLIKMPSTFAEEERMMREFYRIRSMPTVIGCIDCTHIKIRKCGGDAAQYYINRKGFYSLNVQVFSYPITLLENYIIFFYRIKMLFGLLQVTCDSHLRIRDIVARWRGSTHDARIFNESSLKERFETGSFRGRLLGDSGYKLEPYLFTPILRPRNRSEEKYNEAHIATRNTVERCFGVWKQRFQCLLFGMTCKLPNVKTTIVALAVLHNIAVDHGDVEVECSVENNREVFGEVPRGSANANAVLQTFIMRHFSE